MPVLQTSRETSEEWQGIGELRLLARNVSIQYALYTYIYRRGGAEERELWRVYREIVGRHVQRQTIRGQLQLLLRKGIVLREGERYYALVPPSEAASLFDPKRSRAGKKGGLMRMLSASVRSVRVPLGLRQVVRRVLSRVVREIASGRREAALDILAHTLLPLRENAVLWCRHKDVFVYYEPKTGMFHVVRSAWLARIFEKLGFKGILVWHVYGHKRSRRVIKDLFGSLSSWRWGRSVAHALFRIGILEPYDPLRLSIEWRSGVLRLALYTLDGLRLAEYSMFWPFFAYMPPPLSSRQRSVSAVALGHTHVKPSNQETYFSRWLG